MASTRPKKILFFTNSDYGQANVILETVYELMLSTSNIEIHIASFQRLRHAIEDTIGLAMDNAAGHAPAHLVFHGLEGRSQFEAAIGPDVDLFEAYDCPVTFFNAVHTILKIDGIMQPWSPEEFADLYLQTTSVLKDVKPDLTVVEPLFTPALTACNHLSINWIVLSPNTIKDFAIPLQPRLAALWKYPIVCSALPFPLPISHVPMNIALTFVAAYMLLTSQRVENTAAHLKECLGKDIELFTANEMGVLKAAPPGLRILVANSAELDYPFEVLPSHVIPCGPIVRASPGIASTDPSLNTWLAQAPTLYVNLGSHLEMDESEALEMAAAFRVLIDKADSISESAASGLQILWKIKLKEVQGEAAKTTTHAQEDKYSTIYKILGQEASNDRIRLADWITAEPKSVLESGRIICAVNHGGASSFNEALCAGVPQVVLPAWADCYDFANRAELLGIGRWANKNAKPRWSKDELAASLVDVILGPSSEKILLSAQKLGQKYPEDVGRRKAAEVLLDALM
ncbi:glycosyltransferase family 1 [Fusarium albosuccineum]|uniref:Glycosyltransferase family 1 n=1 Tax=Fusarium albosuccineum TaxID=1237068 RepID=A0A8H4PET5_9HYPO|nr:glycosyltransferase family 1 [Fusarium albosuccineum]